MDDARASRNGSCYSDRLVTSGDSSSTLRESVVLSLVLTKPALRQHLAGGRLRRDAADQRRVLDLAELTERLRDAPAAVAARLPDLRACAARLLDRGVRTGVTAVSWTDPAYPPQLAEIDDPPAVLWVRGDPLPLSSPAVAVVGSRTGTPYACAVAEHLAAGLADRGVAVISGLARGVDAAAHRGALAGGGPTVAVLGSGVDVVYPPEHASLADAVVGQGALVSELGPGAPPLRHHFPRRNRILSGLSRAVVVVEATVRSGSLITARLAAEQGREVMAVPGNVLSGRSRGAHRLIRDGARIVETADDILEEIGFGRSIRCWLGWNRAIRATSTRWRSNPAWRRPHCSRTLRSSSSGVAWPESGRDDSSVCPLRW